MKKFIYLTCLTLLFGCSKNQHDEPGVKIPVITDDVSINLANAFAYATKIDETGLKSGGSDTVVTNSSDIEKSMITYLSVVYGPDIEQFYQDNKNNLTPDLNNYENLSDISLDELDENNTQEFVEKIFTATKTNLKSASSYQSTSAAMQNNVDNLIGEIENSIQSFLVDCIESESFDEFVLKNSLLAKIQEYKDNIDWQSLSTDEQVRLHTAISTVENSIGNFISFSLSFPTEDSGQSAFALKSTQSWLKTLIKEVVKAVVITVCLFGATLGGVALGQFCGPPCMIIGGVAGFVSGATAAKHINSWVDKW